MAHSCPICGCACYCHGDIDDIVFERPLDFWCECCDEDDFDDEDWRDEDDDAD